MKVLVSGASGLIGSALVPELEAAGHTVRRLVRREQNSSLEVPWRTDMLHPSAVEPFDAVIHLAGRNIGSRWSAEVKREILESRVQGTATIANAVAQAFRHSGKPGVFVSASGIGIYGSRGDQELTEADSPGTGFLAELAKAWEAATQPASDAGVRVVIARIGVVLSRRGGAIQKMMLPFKLGLGGPVGGGQQWMNWIALDDLIRVLIFALQNSALRGAVNTCAPEAVRNRDFVQALASALHRPAIFPLPAFVVKTLLGEMGEETLLASTRAVPKRLLDSGFEFKYGTIRAAMEHAVGEGEG